MHRQSREDPDYNGANPDKRKDDQKGYGEPTKIMVRCIAVFIVQLLLSPSFNSS
jgi:hypothetical protein